MVTGTKRRGPQKGAPTLTPRTIASKPGGEKDAFQTSELKKGKRISKMVLTLKKKGNCEEKRSYDRKARNEQWGTTLKREKTERDGQTPRSERNDLSCTKGYVWKKRQKKKNNEGEKKMNESGPDTDRLGVEGGPFIFLEHAPGQERG